MSYSNLLPALGGFISQTKTRILFVNIPGVSCRVPLKNTFPVASLISQNFAALCTWVHGWVVPLPSNSEHFHPPNKFTNVYPEKGPFQKENLLGANHPQPIATLCPLFSRENGHLKSSFAHHDQHQPRKCLPTSIFHGIFGFVFGGSIQPPAAKNSIHLLFFSLLQLGLQQCGVSVGEMSNGNKTLCQLSKLRLFPCNGG